jgi:hypothetical protein
MRRVPLVGLFAVTVACGLEQCGIYDPGMLAGEDGSVSADASVTPDSAAEVDASDAAVSADTAVPPVDAGADSGFPCGVDPNACANLNLPAGWKSVAYAPKQAACPSDFGKEAHPEVNPTPSAGACVCTATNPNKPDCQSGNSAVAFDYGMVATCNLGSSPFVGNQGNCAPRTFTLDGDHVSASLLAPTGGSCTSALKLDATKVTTTVTTTCEPTLCPEKLCANQPPPGFSSCVQHDNDEVCPAGFPNKSLVGAGATITACSVCPACVVTNAACTGAKLEFFSDPNCNPNNKVTEVNADGSCQTVSKGAVKTYKYTATATANYDPGTSTPTAAFAKPKTVCCK